VLKHRTMKSYGAVEVKLHTFLTSVLGGGEWSVIFVLWLLFLWGKGLQCPLDRRPRTREFLMDSNYTFQYLVSWLAFFRMNRLHDHYFCLNHKSSDNFLEVLPSFIKSFCLTHHYPLSYKCVGTAICKMSTLIQLQVMLRYFYLFFLSPSFFPSIVR